MRPKLIKVFTTIIGLVPVMFGSETGAEIMKRIATPMVGGLVTSTVHTLVMIPAIYAVVHGWRMRREQKRHERELVTAGDGRVDSSAEIGFDPEEKK